jgi:exosortase/archaeosortase family protein
VNTKSLSSQLKQFTNDQLVAAVMLLGFASLMIWDQFHWWGERDDYSFGYLVPLFVAYVLYDRWPVIKNYLLLGHQPDQAEPTRGQERSRLMVFLEWLALLGFIGGAALFAVGALLRAVTGPQNPASLALAAGFGALLLSTIFIQSKTTPSGQPIELKARWLLACLFIFPALIWLISAPMVSIMETQIRVFLLTKVTIVVYNVLYFLEFDITRAVNVLIFHKDTAEQSMVGVEEACSGIRSLTACLFAGSFLASVFLNRFWKKVLLVGMAMVFAVLTNLLRSFFLTIWAYYNGAEAIDEHVILPILGDMGSVHDLAGYSVLVLTCIGLIALLPIFNFRLSSLLEETGEMDVVEPKVAAEKV